MWYGPSVYLMFLPRYEWNPVRNDAGMAHISWPTYLRYLSSTDYDLFPKLKPNYDGSKLRRSPCGYCCDTMPDKRGQELQSRENRNSLHDIINGWTVVGLCWRVAGCWQCNWILTVRVKEKKNPKYRYAAHNDVSVNDRPHIWRWSHKIVLQ